MFEGEGELVGGGRKELPRGDAVLSTAPTPPRSWDKEATGWWASDAR